MTATTPPGRGSPRRRPTWASDAGRTGPGQAHYGAGPLGGPECTLPAPVRQASRLLAVCAGLTLLGGAFVLGMVSLTPLGLLAGVLVLAYGAFEARVATLLRALVGWTRPAALALAGVDVLVTAAATPAGGLTPADVIAVVVTLGLRLGVVVLLLRPQAADAFRTAAHPVEGRAARP